jgi:hypothetical protein
MSVVSSFATTASAIISVTPAPIVSNHSPYLASKITFTKPSGSWKLCFSDAERIFPILIRILFL